MAIVIIWSRGGPFRRRQVANKAKTWGRCLLFQEIDETGDKARNASFNKMPVTAGLQGAPMTVTKIMTFPQSAIYSCSFFSMRMTLICLITRIIFKNNCHNWSNSQNSRYLCLQIKYCGQENAGYCLFHFVLY